MLRAVVLMLLLLIAPAAGLAQTVSDADRTEFQRVISGQIEAFKADDGVKAYGFAAPNVQQVFPTVDIFMQMVKRGYQPVYRPQSFRFGETGDDPLGRPSQKVTLIGPDGKTYEALYSMERQPDGTWLIQGCTILEIPGLDA